MQRFIIWPLGEIYDRNKYATEILVNECFIDQEVGITGKTYEVSSEDVLKELDWQPLITNVIKPINQFLCTEYETKKCHHHF